MYFICKIINIICISNNNLNSNPVAQGGSEGRGQISSGNREWSKQLLFTWLHSTHPAWNVHSFAYSDNAYKPTHDLLSSTTSFCPFLDLDKSHDVAGLSAFAPHVPPNDHATPLTSVNQSETLTASFSWRMFSKSVTTRSFSLLSFSSSAVNCWTTDCSSSTRPAVSLEDCSADRSFVSSFRSSIACSWSSLNSNTSFSCNSSSHQLIIARDSNKINLEF